MHPTPFMDGWLQGVRRVPSPNWNDRPTGEDIRLLVIHNISLPPGEFLADSAAGGYIDDLFCNQLDTAAHPFFAGLQGLQVSSHFLISRCGSVTQYVPWHKRAWHAGVSCWQGHEGCNDFSIGIELEGTDEMPYTDAQYAALVSLTCCLQQVCPAITPDHIVGHADIAPGRKTDPGPAFDWVRYRRTLESKATCL